MCFVKNKLLVFLLGGCFFANSWVLEYKDKIFYESDFYNYFPKSDWDLIEDNGQREKLFFNFTKQVAGVYEAEALGLHLDPVVGDKLFGRFYRLLVNEYYMKEFLGSVVPKEGLAFCKKHLKKSVFVNHILIKKEEKDLAGSLLDSVRFGGDFSSLALSFSKDPSVNQNKGSLGWITIGQTVPEFQNLVFSLCVGCVGLVETDFGHHVVRVDSVKNSSYLNIEKQEYDDLAFRFATGYIKRPLKDLAAKHDSLLLVDAKVSFNSVLLEEFVDLVIKTTAASPKKNRDNVDFLGLLGGVGGLVFYNGDVLSGQWFVNKFSGPFYKNVYFDSVEALIKEFELILLRDIVYSLALQKGVDNGFSFNKQFGSVRSEILKKEHLKFLIGSVSPPSKQEVEDFYNNNEAELFTNKTTGEAFGLSASYGSVEAILLKEKQGLIQDDFLNSLKNKKNLINKGWLYVD